MALRTAAARGLVCASCRQWMLRSFIASIGGSAAQPGHRRAFSAPPIRRNEARERIQKEERQEEIESGKYTPLAENLDNDTHKTSEQTTHVPWYLQVESPIPEQENVLSARQKIPDLPDHAPAILQPLLERISVELGMDDLSLLDLRGLDPPPALGANLLMIVGTARSEKHLHFSADKLCRWLRSEHHLSPYADGLLGRQELKLKMRRRAKRTRLLSAVGAKATADTELDEGIRTGWICVNLGRVEGGELPKTEEELERERNVVGFGTQSGGSRIVVQLLTEDKRGEIDLEKLWTAVLKKSRVEKEALLEKEDVDNGEGASQAEVSTTSPQQDKHAVYDIPSNTAFGRQQIRGYHTSSRRSYAASIDPPAARLDQHTEHSIDSADSTSLLHSTLDSLAAMPSAAALETLGDDFMSLAPESEDAHLTSKKSRSSNFVKSFYDAVPQVPSQSHWHAHVRLLTLAYRHGHENITNETLTAAVNDITIAGLIPMERTYITVLAALLARIDRHSPTFEHDMEPVFDVLEEMEHYGYNALRPEILEALHRALVGPPDSTQPTTLQSLVPALGIARLKRHLVHGDMTKFWQTWNSFPRRLMPRPVEMYVVLYDALANDVTGLDLHDVREILGYWMSQMEHEEGSVAVETGGVELAMSLFKALKYVDPLAELKEWNETRGKCEKVLRAALQ